MMKRRRLLFLFSGLCSAGLILLGVRYVIGKTYFNAGEKLWWHGEYAEAFPYYKGALRYLPRNLEVRSRLSVLYSESGQHDKNIALAKDTLRFVRTPKDVLGWKSELAAAYILTNHIAEGEQLAVELIRTDPNAPNGYMGLASIREREGRYQEALPLAQKAFDNFLRKYPYPFAHIEDKAHLRTKLAYYHLALNQTERAIEVLREGIDQIPMQKYLENRGSKRPQHVRPLIALLACTYEFQKNTNAAIETWKEVLPLTEKAPEDALVVFAKERLQALPRGPLLQPHNLPPIDSLTKQFK